LGVTPPVDVRPPTPHQPRPNAYAGGPRAAPEGRANCPAPCNYLSVSLRGFAPDSAYRINCQTEAPPAPHTFYSFTARTDAAGDYRNDTSLCRYGRPGRKV
jgi:hypothetical protein